MISVVNKHHPDPVTISGFKAKKLSTIYCGRGSALGNPFTMRDESERDEVCNQYQIYFQNPTDPMLAQLDQIEAAAREGDVALVCFCAPKRCHCDTIKRHIEKRLTS